MLDGIKKRVLHAFRATGAFFKAKGLSVVRFFKNIGLSIAYGVRDFFRAAKQQPKAFKVGLSSFFLMGLGQFRNKQWYKGAPLMAVFLLFIVAELLTSTYIYAPAEIANQPAEDTLYFFRDYGGVFTKGIWGLITLGAVTTYTVYRGQQIRPRGGTYDWAAGDNSRVLLGQGVIVLVLISILVALWLFSIRDAYKTRLKIEAGIAVERFKDFIKRVWEEYFAYIIIIPAALLILMFILIPFIFSFLVAFTNYTGRIRLGLDLISWDGFTTFAKVFGAERAWLDFFFKVIRWTAFYAFMSSFTVYALGFVQALIIESKYVVFKKMWRIILILPWAIPGMISLMVFSNVFGDNFGLMNRLLAEYGLTEQVKSFLNSLGLVNQDRVGNILWFTSPRNAPLARTLIIFVNLWMGFPYFMLLITGVLGTIPLSLYEAADIDGASGVQKFRFITFPWVLRATAPVLITTFTFNFNNFGAIYFLTGGGPGYPRSEIPASLTGIAPGQTDILISWIYKLSFASTVPQYNLAAVYSILIFLFIGMVAIYNLSKLKSFWEEE